MRAHTHPRGDLSNAGMKNGGSRLDDWHGVVADYRGASGSGQMGGIGDGRDVMDYRLQFPG